MLTIHISTDTLSLSSLETINLAFIRRGFLLDSAPYRFLLAVDSLFLVSRGSARSVVEGVEHNSGYLASGEFRLLLLDDSLFDFGVVEEPE
jgi:hypothetical protein